MRKRVTGKKAVALVMASLMIASMAGCGSSGSESSGSGNTSVKEDGSIDTSKHEVINMLVLGNKPTNGRLEAMLDKLNPILTEKVNAELEFTYIEWTDWQTQYNLKLLSGDSSLDLICTATDWLYGWENTKKGAFLPLSEDMLKTYAPKTWEQVSADGDWDICKYNDEIYFIPEDHYTQYTNHGMFYRGDWAKEAGLENGKITKFGGAGGLVPITGFANSVASAAIEYQKEGQVFGIGVKIFTIAGPVILYGIFSSFVAGLIYLFTKQWGWFL